MAVSCDRILHPGQLGMTVGSARISTDLRVLRWNTLLCLQHSPSIATFYNKPSSASQSVLSCRHHVVIQPSPKTYIHNTTIFHNTLSKLFQRSAKYWDHMTETYTHLSQRSEFPKTLYTKKRNQSTEQELDTHLRQYLISLCNSKTKDNSYKNLQIYIHME